MSDSNSFERRNALSSTALAGILVVVIAVAAVGAFTLGRSPQVSTSNTSTVSSSSMSQPNSSTTSASSTSSSTSSSSPASSSSTTSTTSTTTSTTSISSTSSATSTTSTSSSTSSAFNFDFVVEATPDPILVAVGGNAAYPQLTLSPLPAASSGTESITLNATSPAGLTVAISPKTTTLSTDTSSSVGISFNASQSLAPGVYKVTIGTQYGGISKTSDITIRVVQYLIMQQQNGFNPSALTVKQGSTVYWINLDSPSRFDVEVHNVVFIQGSTSRSPDMQHFITFSFVFSAPGTYLYVCSYHSGMKGTVTVTQ